MGGLLLALREGAIDVLKKCNENEDDARAGEFCAKELVYIYSGNHRRVDAENCDRVENKSFREFRDCS